MVKKDATQDIFIRRLYRHKGVNIIVDIDLENGTISLVESKTTGYKPKNWTFAGRTIEYMDGWLTILDAMKNAISMARLEIDKAAQVKLDEFINSYFELRNLKGKK